MAAESATAAGPNSGPAELRHSGLRAGGVVIGDPGALGVLAFSITSLMLGLFNANLINSSGAAIVVPVALVFGGVVQLGAALLQVLRGNAFSATVFGSFGSFWVTYGLIQNTYAGKVAAAATSAKANPVTTVTSALGVFLTMFLILSVIFTIAAARTDAVLFAVLVLVDIAILLLVVGVTGSHESLVHASGWVTIIFAAGGLYHGSAHLIEHTYRRPVLPLGDLSPKTTRH